MAGIPESMLTAFGAAFLALVWMPITGVLISGSIVKQAVEERQATPQALSALLGERWPEGDETQPEAGSERQDASRRAQAAARQATEG